MIAELVHDVVQKHLPEAEQSGVALGLDGAGAVQVEADIAMTERILDNLISNALRHAPDGGRVALTVTGQDGGAMVTVADNGPGIDAEEMAHLFEPFYQGSGNASGSHAGLGLAIAQRMTELQQGRISVHNRSQGGAEFRLWLPSPAAAG